MSSNWTQNIGLSHPGRVPVLKHRFCVLSFSTIEIPCCHNTVMMILGTHKSVFFSKKVVVWFEKLGLLCVAADTKSWSLASRKAANLLQPEAGEDDVDLYGGIAALRLANDQLFVSAATRRSPNFSNQTTTFLEKKTDFCVPNFFFFRRNKIFYMVLS